MRGPISARTAPNRRPIRARFIPVSGRSGNFNSLIGGINSLFGTVGNFCWNRLESLWFLEPFSSRIGRMREIPCIFPCCREFGRARGPGLVGNGVPPPTLRLLPAGDLPLFSRSAGSELTALWDGVPLGCEVFAGNRTDVTTAGEIVTTMERPLWSGAPLMGDEPWHGGRRDHRLAVRRPSALFDRREQARAEARRPDCRSPGLAASARRGRSQGLRRPG